VSSSSYEDNRVELLNSILNMLSPSDLTEAYSYLWAKLQSELPWDHSGKPVDYYCTIYKVAELYTSNLLDLAERAR
jgi:hypothetical protein